MAAPRRMIFKKRATITALPLYHSGVLLKKYTGEKDFKKYHGELRGSTIFLYTDETQDTYTEKLDLQMLKSMKTDSYHLTNTTIFTLSLHKEEVQLKMDCPDKGEEWRGFIETVAHGEIPKKIQLLPGQIQKLKEVLEEEQKRLLTPPQLPPKGSTSPTYNSSLVDTQVTDCPSALPTCFFDVSRQKAEQMLKENPEFGNIILRPSTVGYALTLRQDTPSGHVFKNYRVLPKDGMFSIELETPVTVPSLRDALEYFLKETKYRLHLYNIPPFYDKTIEVPPVFDRAQKPVPHARVAPMIHTRTPSGDFPPNYSPPPPLTQTPAHGGEYMDVDVPLKPVAPVTRPGRVDEELRAVLDARREQIYRSETS